MSDAEITKREHNLPEIERQKRKIITAQDELVMTELRNMLLRQQEQDIVITDLREIVDHMATGMVTSIEEIQKLQRTVQTLERHQKTLNDRQDTIAGLCDRLVESITENSEP